MTFAIRKQRMWFIHSPSNSLAIVNRYSQMLPGETRHKCYNEGGIKCKHGHSRLKNTHSQAFHHIQATWQSRMAMVRLQVQILITVSPPFFTPYDASNCLTTLLHHQASAWMTRPMQDAIAMWVPSPISQVSECHDWFRVALPVAKGFFSLLTPMQGLVNKFAPGL